MQSLRLPHTYCPPLLPAPPPAHCQGSRGAAATFSPGSLLPLHGGVRVPLHRTRVLVHGHTRPCRCCAGTCARVALARTRACSVTRVRAGVSRVGTGDARAASLHKQGQPSRRTRAASRASRCTHLSLRRTHEGTLCLSSLLLWCRCCWHIPEEGWPALPAVCSPGSPFSSCPFLVSSIITPHFPAAIADE